MEKQCVLKAPAKLNLHLQVGDRRSDGFHDLNSLFIMVDLYDEINARSLKTDNDCRINGDFNCSVESNLIYKAWWEFCSEVGYEVGIEFSVEKNIPSFAGLGGGSSDAAAALKIMNFMFDTDFDDIHLAEIGSRIGSDVPFFLTAPAAFISGRGEKVKGIEAVEHDFVLIHPQVEISTAEAYAWLDSSVVKRAAFLSEERICEVYKGDCSAYNEFSNDFSYELNERFNVFPEIDSALKQQGAVYSSITGSGSAVFGLFESAAEAENAQKNLQNKYKFVQKIKSLDRIPYAILE